MEFESGHLYHIFNRGNNSQKVFFTRDNYLHFLKKIKKHLLPHADLLAWCLMPNHFHLMVYVNQVEIRLSDRVTAAGFTEQVTAFDQSNADQKLRSSFENSHLLSKSLHLLSKPLPRKSKSRSLSDSIGIILRSYTRAIQKQEGYTGSLFQNRTKAICLTLPEDLSPAYFQTSFGVIVNIDLCEKDYPQVCFNYIHSNPVNAGLVKLPEQWWMPTACVTICKHGV